MGMMGSIGENKHEPFALLFGVLGLLTGILFFLNRYHFITIKWRVSDDVYLLFFAGFTILLGIISLLTTLGLIGTD